jgi:hypothetical protein
MDLTYEKIIIAEHELIDLSKAGANTVVNAYHVAWNAYEEARDKLWEFGKTSMDSAFQQYELAKTGLSEATQKLQELLKEYKTKAVDKTSDAYHIALEKLDQAQLQAIEKYHSARDTMGRLYEDAHTEAVKDFNKTKTFLDESTQKLKQYSENVQAKTNENYEATKKQLEIGKEKANVAFEASKKKADELRERMVAFNSSMLNSLQDNYENMKIRASQSLDTLNGYVDNAEAKGQEGYEAVKLRLQVASERASKNLKIAEEKLLQAKDKIAVEAKSLLNAGSEQTKESY